MSSPRCSATTKAGKPCQAFAVKGTSPALCAAHAGRNVGAGAPEGNQNRRSHGFYGRYYSAAELEALEQLESDGSLDGEIAVVRVALGRAMALMGDEEQDLSPALVMNLAKLVYAGGRTVARLLRDKRLLTGEQGDNVMEELGRALDDLGAEWGMDL